MSKIIRRMCTAMIILEKTRYIQQASACRPAPSHAEIINFREGSEEKNRE